MRRTIIRALLCGVASIGAADALTVDLGIPACDPGAFGADRSCGDADEKTRPAPDPVFDPPFDLDPPVFEPLPEAER